MPDQILNLNSERKPDGVAGSRDKFDLHTFRTFIKPSNITLLVTTVTFFVILIGACGFNGGDPGSWNVLLVATGALAGGGLLGFIYGSYGSDVTTRFSPVFSLVGGLLTGATIADLSRNESGISHALNSLASACGLNGAGGLIVAIICTFAPVGFVLMYVNLGLMLSLPASKIMQFAQRPSETEVTMSRELIQAKVSIVDAGSRAGPRSTDFATATAAVVLANNPGAGETGSVEKLLDDARAFAALGKVDMVETALRNALKQRPHDTRIKYELGLHLLFNMTDREVESIPYLEDVVQSPDAPAIAWKMLGFACLWDPKTLMRSTAATQKYLELYPHDTEAKLWLAAAHAQLVSPDNQEEREAILKEVGELVRADPFMRQRIREMADDGDDDDFTRWRRDPAFQELFGAST